MQDIFSLVDSPSYDTKIKKGMQMLNALSYDTIVRATSGTVKVDDYQKVCFDTYREVTAHIQEILADLKRDYDTRSDLSDVVLAAKTDFHERIIPKWKEMTAHANRCVAQLFQDATSEHIYTYPAAMEVLYLLRRMCEFFLSNESLSKTHKTALATKIYKKCLQYSADSLFTAHAGEPLKALGYTDLVAIYDVSNGYGHIVEAMDSESVLDTLNRYKQSVETIANTANTLNVLLSKNITRGEAIDEITLTQYRDLLTKAKALKSIHRIVLTMAGLISSLQKTVSNITDAAYRSQTGELLKNVTHDMGGTLSPTVIETQAIATEGFLGRIFSRIKTAWADSDVILTEKYKSLDPFMTFIHEHVDPSDVETYLKNKKWRAVPLSVLESGVKAIESTLKSQQKFVDKFKSTADFKSLFAYPTSKGFDIPEIMSLHNTMKKLGNIATISYRDRYSRTVYVGEAPEKTKNILKDEDFNVCMLYKQLAYPDLGAYVNSEEKFTAVKLLSGTQIGISTVEDLDKLVTLAQQHGPICKGTYIDDGPNYEDLDKNASSIHDSKYRDITVANVYRAYVWHQYYWMLVGMYAWSVYMPYVIIRDIKKYA